MPFKRPIGKCKVFVQHGFRHLSWVAGGLGLFMSSFALLLGDCHICQKGTKEMSWNQGTFSTMARKLKHVIHLIGTASHSLSNFWMNTYRNEMCKNRFKTCLQKKQKIKLFDLWGLRTLPWILCWLVAKETCSLRNPKPMWALSALREVFTKQISCGNVKLWLRNCWANLWLIQWIRKFPLSGLKEWEKIPIFLFGTN